MIEISSVKKNLKIIRFVLILSASLIIGWLGYKDFVPSGVLEIENNFKSKSVLISQLYPENRLKEIEKPSFATMPAGRQEVTEGRENGVYFQTIRIDPVYFDLTIPRFFKTAKVIIKYQNPLQNQFQIGIKDVNSEWNFLFKTLEDREKGIVPLEKDDWQIAQAEFKLQPWFIKDRKIYFILSSPLLYDKQEEIKIAQIKIILEREPWTKENFLPRVKDYFKRMKNK